MLIARLRQSIVAAAGVAFSIMMFIALTGFMTGLNKMLDGLILNRTPHVRLYNEIRPVAQQPADLVEGLGHVFLRSVKPKQGMERLHNAQAIMAAMGADPRVEGVAPKVVAQVFFNVGTTELPGVVNGMDPLAEARLFRFTDYLVEGELEQMLQDNTIVLGRNLAEMMMADIDAVVQVTTARGERTLLKVVGFYQSGLADYDKVQCYASIKNTQKLLGEPANYITDIQLRLKDLALAPVMAEECERLYRVDAVDIQEANAQFETGTKVRNIISYATSIVLLVVAGFGIYNILNMMIYEKLDSIAILKATGFSGRDVRRIFVGLSMIIGVLGGAVGLLAGLGLAELISHIPFETPALPTIKTYPVDFSMSRGLIGLAFALTTTYMAGFFPARKASRIDPVQIIRGK